MDLSPVSTAVLKGLLTPMVSDGVNFVNAPVLAKSRGIKVREVSSVTSEDYVNLITITAITEKGRNVVSGTIIGKRDPRLHAATLDSASPRNPRLTR